MLKIPVNQDDHILGDPKAPVVLVEYGDYECPYCGQAYPIVKRVQKHFGKRMAFVFRNFPLTEIHPNAEMAAQTTEFAAAQGRFWEMHDGLYENQQMLGPPLFIALAQKLELSVEDLNLALTNGTYASRVKSDFMGGVRSGVNGTPTFFINGDRHDGAFGFDDLVVAIEARLQK
ncbi:MAG TPA: DsbA family protein [Phycisphaerae bacterium]|nr:DsbA family protein [Phycisphaerae bacterium]